MATEALALVISNKFGKTLTKGKGLLMRILAIWGPSLLILCASHVSSLSSTVHNKLNCG